MPTDRTAKGPRVIWFDKPPFYRRFWTYVWLLLLPSIASLMVFTAWHGYHFPCRIGEGGAYNCVADSATRWAAAIRDVLGSILCGAVCPIMVFAATHIWWAGWMRPSHLRKKYIAAGIPEEQYLRRSPDA